MRGHDFMGVLLDRVADWSVSGSPAGLDWQRAGLASPPDSWDFAVAPWLVAAPRGARMAATVARILFSGGTLRATLYRRPVTAVAEGDASGHPADDRLDERESSGGRLDLMGIAPCRPGDGLFVLLTQVSGASIVLAAGGNGLRSTFAVQFGS